MAVTVLHQCYKAWSSTSTPTPAPGFLSPTKPTSCKLNMGAAQCSRFRRRVRKVEGKGKKEEREEVWRGMEEWVRENILTILKPIDKSWQPQELLPEAATEAFVEEVKELRRRAKELPDEYFVVLVGDMITEEALPTYQTRLTVCNGVLDVSGADHSAWATWNRAWSAEENRHGDLLNKYLYLSGRVDMHQVEKTIQHLIASGMDVGIGTDPYCGVIYTAFQERATLISHANTAKLAMKHGDAKLAQICGTIASDEKRHESAYSKMAEKLLEVDPDGMMVALGYMMRRKITMPAHFMYDGHDPHLFAHFSKVASRIGVYTHLDYIQILEHFLAKWKIPTLSGLSPEARRAQDYVCALPSRYRLLARRAPSSLSQSPHFVPFSWIFHRPLLA